MDLVEIGKGVLTSCMDVKAGENVLVITDDGKFPIGDALYQAAKAFGRGELSFYDEKEFAHLQKLYGDMSHFQGFGRQ